jgi:tRNA-Thr(GGU) m(6)t(6)A37 methyltransferase TsaA
MIYTVQPIGFVRSPRTAPIDDDWGGVESTIELDPDLLASTATAGLAEFSHVEVVYLFHLVRPEQVNTAARHPRGNPDWPRVGILAQRAKARPNRLGTTVCDLVASDGLVLTVRGLDAIDGTPVLDIKPYLAEFGPRGAVRQPAWSTELMRDYW